MLIYRIRSLEKYSPLISGVHYAGAGVQELTLEGVGVFQQESEQDQEWFLIIPRSVLEILMCICILRDCDRS